jgi:N-acetylglucosaminyldiphosphoundecaprenol N-acetyl-beta-D-mannosaminyltransferase
MSQERPRRVEILGCQVSRVDLAGALRELERLLEDQNRHQVACLTVDSIMIARKDPRLRSIYQAATLALPDGIPVVWASRLLGAAVPGRAAGPDLLLALCAVANRKGYTSYLMGGGAGIAERLAERLAAANPGLKIVGTCSPPFLERFPPALTDQILARINAAKPDILWVGLGAGKQDRWIAENLSRLEVRVAIGVGAAFDMYGAGRGRAPLWMQRWGLEWFYRFLREPRRLFQRYFIEALPFFPLVILQRLRQGHCFSGGQGISF